MGPLHLLRFACLCLCLCLVVSDPFVEFVYPNFSTSFQQRIDRNGAFLFSRNGTFTAAMCCPGYQNIRSYLCVIHSDSNLVTWSANGDSPVSTDGRLNFTSTGIRIRDRDGSQKWSTPAMELPISALRLTDQGNLMLISESNGTLWQSFDHPTDTIVNGQGFPMGLSLRSSVSSDDFGTGAYKLSLIGPDAILQWQGLTYWKLSMAVKAYADSSYVADYFKVNATGLYLLGGVNGSAGVIQVDLPLPLPPSAFRIAKLDYMGQLLVRDFVGGKWNNDFAGPDDSCRIPLICGKLGFCSNGGSPATMPLCSCPSNFKQGTENSSYCVPTEASFSLPPICNSTNTSTTTVFFNSSSVSYIPLGYGVNYFTNQFTNPTKYNVNLWDCQNLCTQDCNCYGSYFDNSSRSCSLLENRLGSFILTNNENGYGVGYIKVFVTSNNTIHGRRGRIPLPGLVMLPLASVSILIGIGYVMWRRSRISLRSRNVKSFHSKSFSSEDEEAFSIPGLPVRFEYREIEEATENFKTEIGSGGFGSVYKAVLPDKSLAAVKKINNLGIQGKKDFLAEIAIIGNIHHVNLVKLKGFCAQGRHRLLIYEYMNRSSLDRSLFGGKPVLEWKERVEITLGAARGLAYLHCGCEGKIIHCDVKPENILLHDKLQAKLSDFGLSKLLSPEQSSHFTTMRGTRGYLAPEWLTSSAISEKTDVYSFGMMLLEIVSGRKNCPTKTENSHNLVEDTTTSGSGDGTGYCSSSSSSTKALVYFPLLALEMHEQKRYLELADSRIKGRVSSEEIEKFIRIGLCCVHEDPSHRPNMVDIIGMLEGGVPLCTPKLGSLNFLRFYGLRFAEPSMVEGTERLNDVPFHPYIESTPLVSTRSGSNALFSYMSSQQISGPR